jgi:YgiT-type zinc finger domain-containing protein
MKVEKRLCRCGGEEEPRTIRYTLSKGEALVAVDNVPAWVCRRCGETYFSAEVSQQLEKIICEQHPAPRRLNVPVYDFASY